MSLYLQFGYIPEPHSIFKNSYKLKAGHYIEIDLKSQKIEEIKYWDVVDFYRVSSSHIDLIEDKSSSALLLDLFFLGFIGFWGAIVASFCLGSLGSSSISAFLA